MYWCRHTLHKSKAYCKLLSIGGLPHESPSLSSMLAECEASEEAPGLGRNRLIACDRMHLRHCSIVQRSYSGSLVLLLSAEWALCVTLKTANFQSVTQD